MIILFDLDGTLIESTNAIVSTFHHAYNEQGGEHPDDEDIKALIGYPLDVMFSKLGIDKERVWDYVNAYKERYRKISKTHTELLVFTKEAVERASKIATLGIVTTKTGLYSQELMEHFGLMHHFEALIGREHVDNPKPHQEPIQKALKALARNDDDVWMIGDTRLDLLSAKNAGVNSIAVLSGYDDEEELGKHTPYIFDDALKAVEFLESKVY